MFQETRTFRSILAMAALAAILAAGSTVRAEEETISGFSAWEGEGTVYDTGANTGTFVGAISGTLFIQTENGPAAAGHMVCPALLEIDLQSATQVGAGKCTITGDDGAKVFAEWTCQGVHLVGCDGEIKLTGGTGRMSGITGGGSLSVRTITQLAAMKTTAAGSVAETGKGILMLNDLKYSLPQQ
jgi:hypothetical protein